MASHKNPRIDPVLLKDPFHCLSLGFGTGLASTAPGTFGTLIGIPLFLLMKPLSIEVYCLVSLILFIFGIWLCERTANKLEVHDHPGIVWDEVVGYAVTMIIAPNGWMWVLIGFILFRIFDVWKPWPIRLIDQKVTGGLGIMLDDLIAGIFALISMQILVVLM
ncbi:MAG: phosphatidylglycerophosphatase A [Gammaproteobacteria bacterium]